MKHRAMLKYYRKIGGSVYGMLYRVVMGTSALVHLVLLAAVFPFGDKKVVRLKAAKWNTVLRWSVGLDQPPINV
jgi:hypothetical protein